MKKQIGFSIVLLASVVLLGALMGSGIQTSAYSLIKNAGSALTRRQTLNCGSGLTCSDDSGNNWTNIAASGGGGGNSTITVANAGSTGTTTSTLTKLTGAPSTAVITATSDSTGAVGVTTSGAGTTGSATITIAGTVSCVFDGATTAGHYVQISSMVAGNCTDGGATYPTSGQILGRVLSTNGSGGTFTIDLFPSEIRGTSGGGGGGYSTIQSQGSSLTQRATVNFIGPYFNCVDNSGATKTDCTAFGPLPPTIGASTWVNQATATASSSNGIISISDSANEDGLHILVNTLPSTPYTLTLRFSYYMAWVISKYPEVVFALRDSGTGKMEEIDAGNNQGFPGLQVPSTLAVNQWTNATSLASTVATVGPFSGPLSCFRLADNGSNTTYSYSVDCENFTQLFSEAHGAFITANQWGWGIRTNSSAGQLVMESALSFLQQ